MVKATKHKTRMERVNVISDGGLLYELMEGVAYSGNGGDISDMIIDFQGGRRVA